MAINKRKVLETARKYAQKGAQAKALKEFDKLLKLDPRDARLRLEIGDAHRRWGNADEAIETYTRVAEQYTKEGFDARAVAVYKQIHNLKPNAYESYAPLAELYQRMGLNSEAILTLQTAADGYHKAGKKTEALELLRKMATLDPTNTTSRIKVGDLLRQEGLTDQAVSEYEEAGRELERQGDVEAATGVYERILEVVPDQRETLVKLAETLVDRGLADRAEPFVKRVLEAEPEEPARYELMAAVYRLQQRDEELADVYRKLADLYRRRGDDEQAREILQRYVPSEEFEEVDVGLDEQTAFGALDSAVALAEQGQPQSVLPEHGAASIASLSESQPRNTPIFDPDGSSALDDEVLEMDVDDDNYLSPNDGEPIELELDDPLDSLAVHDAVAPPDSDSDPEQLLAEANVYLRYGKREQAIANLEAIVGLDPRHRTALEKLGEVRAEAGQETQAIAAWLQAADAARAEGDFEGVSVLRDRIAALDPEAANNLGPPLPEDSSPGPISVPSEGEATVVAFEAFDSADFDSIPADESESQTELSREIDLDDIEIDIDDSEFAEEIPTPEDDDEPAAEVSDPVAAEGDGSDTLDVAVSAGDSNALGPGASESMVHQIGEDLEEADFYMKQGLADEAEAIYQRVLSIAPNHPHALVRLGEVAALRGEDPATSHRGTSQQEAADGASSAASHSAAEKPASSFREDIPGPDDDAFSSPEDSLSFAQDEDAEADAGEEAGADASLDGPIEATAAGSAAVSAPDLEDELASQFLAEVTEPAGLEAPIPSESDSEDADSSADLAAFEPGPDDSSEDDDTESESVASEAAAEAIASPDDFLGDSGVDLGGVAERTTVPETLVAEVEADADEASFDLAAELSDVFDDSDGSSGSGLGDSGDGFESVFREFKKGVSQALSEDDHEAHFDLGIAYREMGLFDDAKSEFRAAMLNSEREIQCRHMLGLCCLAQENYEEAVAEFEQIAAAADATDEQQISAQFELGRGFEALGDKARARTAYETVAEIDGDFCGVRGRLEKLDATPDPDDAAASLESFDDLIADVESSAGEASAETTGGYETFDDLMEEEAATEAAAATDPEAVPEEADRIDSEPEPEGDSGPEREAVNAADAPLGFEEGPGVSRESEMAVDTDDSDAAPAVPEPPSPKKRKKISFV